MMAFLLIFSLHIVITTLPIYPLHSITKSLLIWLLRIVIAFLPICLLHIVTAFLPICLLNIAIAFLPICWLHIVIVFLLICWLHVLVIILYTTMTMFGYDHAFHSTAPIALAEAAESLTPAVKHLLDVILSTELDQPTPRQQEVLEALQGDQRGRQWVNLVIILLPNQCVRIGTAF